MRISSATTKTQYSQIHFLKLKKKKMTSKCSRHWGYHNEQTAPCSGGACILLRSEGADKDNHTCKVVSESVKSLEKNSDVMESA